MGKKILFDADVLIHFDKGGQLSLLPQIYPGRLCIMDEVLQELRTGSSARTTIDQLIQQGDIESVAIAAFPTAFVEYAQLIRRLGRGESACMALARFDDRYLASSNLRDIQVYCEKHSIHYVTTLDILVQVEQLGLLSEADCDQFIRQVKQRNSRLPVNSLAEYLQKFTVRRV